MSDAAYRPFRLDSGCSKFSLTLAVIYFNPPENFRHSPSAMHTRSDGRWADPALPTTHKPQRCLLGCLEKQYPYPVRLQNLPWYKTGLVSRQVLHLLSKLQNWIYPKTGQYKACIVQILRLKPRYGLLNPNPDSHTLPLRQSKYIFKMKRQV